MKKIIVTLHLILFLSCGNTGDSAYDASKDFKEFSEIICENALVVLSDDSRFSLEGETINIYLRQEIISINLKGLKIEDLSKDSPHLNQGFQDYRKLALESTLESYKEDVLSKPMFGLICNNCLTFSFEGEEHKLSVFPFFLTEMTNEKRVNELIKNLSRNIKSHSYNCI